jgi:hypothetical protein
LSLLKVVPLHGAAAEQTKLRAIVSDCGTAYLTAILTTVVVLAVFFALAYAATFVPRDLILEKLKAANAKDEFAAQVTTPFGTQFPRYDANDCLDLQLVVEKYPSRLNEAFSPSISSLGLAEARDGVRPSCLGLILLLEHDAYDPSPTPYHRYLHGHRVFTRVAAAFVPPLALGWITGALNFGTLLSILVPALWRTSKKNSDWRRDATFAAIAASLLFFDGLWLFGFYFTHAQFDLVLAAFVAYAYHARICRAPESRMLLAVAVFGSLIAVFEFLTGGAPFGLAVLLALIAVDGPDDRVALIRRALHGSLILCLTIALAFSIKIGLATAIYGVDVLTWSVAELGLWLPGHDAMFTPNEQALFAEHPGLRLVDRFWLLKLLYVIAKLLVIGGRVVGYGSALLGATALVGGFAAAAYCLWRRLRRAITPIQRTRCGLLLCSMLVMPAWVIIFLNHTLAHAFWMVRPFGWWVGIAAITALAIPLRPASIFEPSMH